MGDDEHELALAAFRKKREGAILSEDEEAALRVYYAQYKDRRHSLYFESGEQKATMRALAEDAGYTNFNAWIVEQIKLATSGEMVDAEVLSMLRGRVDELERREEQAHARAEEFRQQRDHAVSERDEAHERMLAYADALRDVAVLLKQHGIQVEVPEA